MNTLQRYSSIAPGDYLALIHREYRSARACVANGLCVQVAAHLELVGIQDSKLPARERTDRTVVCSRASFDALITDAKDGRHDRL